MALTDGFKLAMTVISEKWDNLDARLFIPSTMRDCGGGMEGIEDHADNYYHIRNIIYHTINGYDNSV